MLNAECYKEGKSSLDGESPSLELMVEQEGTMHQSPL
jgi:hypothetical protein